MTIQIFKRVELPTQMFVSELVMWVALGRAPESGMDDIKEAPGQYRWDDWRTNIDCAYEDIPNFMDLPFSQSEFSLIGIDKNYDDYLQDWINAGSETSEELQRRSEALLEYLPNKELAREEREKIKRQTHIADRIRDLERPFLPLIDRAYAKVFSALSSGHLECEGWVFDEFCEDSEPKLMNVPSQAWTFSGFDKVACSLFDSKVNYRAVRTNVSKALDYFPSPELSATEISGTLIGDSFISATPSFRVPARRMQGRPPKGGGTVREVVQNVFQTKKRRKELPEKKEAQIQEVIEFVKVAFKDDISRSTAQSYLKNL